MPDGPQLTLLNWVLAALPVVTLVGTVLAFGWSAPRAGAGALLLALLLGWTRFGGDAQLLAVASSKGLSLSLFILTILWAAVFLYNLIRRLGSVEVIGTTLASLSGERLGVGLLIAWAFSGFIQGIAGFGVPVAVVAPLMVLAGFPAVEAVTAVLVGHAWAVAFGSMGSPFYTIQLVTGIPEETIGPRIALLLAPSIVVSGLAVAHIIGGFHGLRRYAPVVLVSGSVMALFVWLTVRIGAAQIGALVPGLVGCGVLWMFLRGAGRKQDQARVRQEASSATGNAGNPMSFHLAFLPYYLLIGLTALSQVSVIKEAMAPLAWGLDYPAQATSLGFQVAAEEGYARISLFRHPAPLILASALLTYVVFRYVGSWQRGATWEAVVATYRQSQSTSVGMATMVMMAVVMIDTGMTSVLARGIADATGVAFPFVSPFIGVLGTFLTGSNTSSNVMFGALQVETARTLAVSTVTMASAQSIGGSLGSSIAPAKVLVGTALVGLQGHEVEVLRKAIPYCLIVVIVVGVEVWIASHLL